MAIVQIEQQTVASNNEGLKTKLADIDVKESIVAIKKLRTSRSNADDIVIYCHLILIKTFDYCNHSYK